MKKLNFICLVSVVLSGCSTAELGSGGSRVIMAQANDVTACKNIGPVLGQGGGSFGGAFISNTNLMKHALNDLRNKAAEIGATHVVVGGPQLGGNGGTTSTATVMGIAYLCSL